MTRFGSTHKNPNPYRQTRGGKREDLNDRYFRSAWEANFARHLNFLVENGDIMKWEYEPDTFEFTAIKRGTRSYLPDFKVWDTADAEPYYYEIKGWMDAKSKTRLNRMAKYAKRNTPALKRIYQALYQIGNSRDNAGYTKTFIYH
jgi:hypothetical protein